MLSGKTEASWRVHGLGCSMFIGAGEAAVLTRVSRAGSGQRRPARTPALASGLLPTRLTSRGLQPLLFDAIPDLGFRVALGKVAGDDSRVALIHFDHVLHIQLEVLEVCGERREGDV